MFEAEVYGKRRDQLARAVGSGLLLLPGNSLIGMNYRANVYPFRQDGSFLYFCGLDAPDLWLVLDVDNDEHLLCAQAATMDDTIWSGSVPAPEVLASRSGLTRCCSRSTLTDMIRAARSAGRPIHYLPPYQADGILRLSSLLEVTPEMVQTGWSEELVRAVVALRSVKSASEVAEIRQAISLSEQVYGLIFDQCRSGMTEMELYGQVQGLVAAAGSRESFPTILTRRGQILHNHDHLGRLQSGDLLLVDSGVCSPCGYASDITRTVPVSGCFTPMQREIYEIVLAGMTAAMEAARPGVPFLSCHLTAALVMTRGLTDLGLMRGDPAEAVAAGAHALFFPHGLGHMLGLDVHDMESLGEDYVGYDGNVRRAAQFGLSGLRLGRALQAGFVLTVEPGLYFIPALVEQWQSENRHCEFINYAVLERYRDFGGIRIEDDVLITEQGAENLSLSVPKTVRDLSGRMEWQV